MGFKDREIPTFRYDLKIAINRLAQSCDGKKLDTGDINGHIAIFTNEKDIVIIRSDDVTKFEYIIMSIEERCKLEAEKKK